MSVSSAVRAGDFIFLTGVAPRVGDDYRIIEEQTRIACETIRATLTDAGRTLDDVVKAMVWLRERSDFPEFNKVFGEFFPVESPALRGV